MSTENDSKPPLLDRASFARNPKTTWLSFVDKLGSHLWATKEGKARWTLILDDALRHASTLHPSNTAAGLEKQALHQSYLRNALMNAFADIYPAIVAMHPNTDATDADGRIIPFGTNLLREIGAEIVPDDPEGVTTANNDFSRALADFPGMTRGLKALQGWCDRITILYNDLVRLSRHDLDQHTCAQLDNLLILHDGRGAEELKWSRLRDAVHAKPDYIAAPRVSIYIAAMRRFGADINNAKKLFVAPPGTKPKKHFREVFSAAAVCWCCQGSGHEAQDCRMVQTALADYHKKHLHGAAHPGVRKGNGSAFKFKKGTDKNQGTSAFRKHGNKQGARFNNKRGSAFKGRNKQRDGHAVHFAGSSSTGADALPPPVTPIEQHFAFHIDDLRSHYVLCDQSVDATPDYEAVYPSKTPGKRPASDDQICGDDDEEAIQKRRRIYSPVTPDDSGGYDSDDSDDSMPGLIPPDQDVATKNKNPDLTVTFTSTSSSEGDPDSSSQDNVTNEAILATIMQKCTKKSALITKDHLLFNNYELTNDWHIDLIDISAAYISAPLPLTKQETLFNYYTANFLADNYPAWEVNSIDRYGSKWTSADHAFDHSPHARVEANCGPDNEIKIIELRFPPRFDSLGDHAFAYWLEEFKREIDELKCIKLHLANTTKFEPDVLSPQQVSNIKSIIKERQALAYAKILAFPSDPTSASWTQPKDITPAILHELIAIGNDAPMQLLMRQVYVYLHAYIDENHFSMDVNYITRADFPVPDLAYNGNKLTMTATIYCDDAVLTNCTFKYGKSDDILATPLLRCECGVNDCDLYDAEIVEAGRAYSPTAPSYSD